MSSKELELDIEHIVKTEFQIHQGVRKVTVNYKDNIGLIGAVGEEYKLVYELENGEVKQVE